MHREKFQKRSERRLRNGAIARFEPRRGEVRYIYHREDRYWLLAVDTRDGMEKLFEKPVPMYQRRRIFEDQEVEVVTVDDVPGPVAALSRASAD